MSAPPSSAPDRTEELRLALVLNGGVSLCVWMGGVAFELNRLVRETHPVFRGLLELTRTVARIDVISGTSAGGVNGAALALAQVHDAGLYSLREVWVSGGGLERLSRDPDDADPSSLLRGDNYFLPQIETALAFIAGGKPRPAEEAPMQLSLTTTLLRGVGERYLDDFGAVIEDTVHRARFAYTRGGEGGGATHDDFADGSGIVRKLARAARASSSFPVAFEPALYLPDKTLAAGSARGPLTSQGAQPRPVAEPAYLLDGGILDNKPFAAALEAITRLPADGNTRRVLAYVVPDPHAAVGADKPDADGRPPAPTLAEVARRSLVGIPARQSIADQLAAVREHNDLQLRRWQRLAGLVRHTAGTGPQQGAAARLRATAATLFEAYRARRRDGVIDHLLNELETALAPDPGRPAPTAPATAEASTGSLRPDDDTGLRRATRYWLRAVWSAPRDGAEPLWAPFVPAAFEPEAPIVGSDAPQWRWGLYAVEFMADLTIDLLRRTQRLHDLIDRWQDPEYARGPAFEPAGAVPAPEDPTWEAIDARPADKLRRGLAEPAGGALTLRQAWHATYAIRRRLRDRRASEIADARRQAGPAFARFRRCTADGEHSVEAAMALLGDLLPADLPNAGDAKADARELCQVVAGLRQPIDAIRSAHDAYGRALRADAAAAWAALRAYADYLYGPGLRDPSGDAPLDAIAWRLLALEVIEVAASSRQQRPNAGAELVQVSARLQSPWGGPAQPLGKLTGMALAHFAAFYKRSWRANDWLYGRLDGIDRALRIALDPDRLQRLYGHRRVRVPGESAPLPASEYVRRHIEALAVGSAAPALRETLRTAWQRCEADITTELRWLDEPTTAPPPMLDHCAAALTRRLHLEVLMSELPELAKAIDEDAAAGAPPSQAGRALRARLGAAGEPVPALDPATAIALLRDGLLGGDRLADEAGSDQFTRAVGRSVAVAHAAAAAQGSGLGKLKVLLEATRWPVTVFHWLTARLPAHGATSAALQGAAIGIGAVLVLAALLTKELASPFAVAGWALLAAGLAATLLRDWRAGVLAVAMGVLLVTVARPHPSPWVFAFGLVFALALALALRGSGTLATASLLGLAVWWTAGQPSSMAVVEAMWCQRVWQGAAVCATEAVRKAHEQGKRLGEVAVPALLIVVIVLSARAMQPRRLRKPSPSGNERG